MRNTNKNTNTNRNKNTNTNANRNINTNTRTNKNAVGNRTAATKMPGYVLSGTRDGAVKLTLPKGTYTIDGDGNLIIHGGGNISGGEAGGMPFSTYPGLSYEEFMEKPDGRSAESRAGGRVDPFGMDFSALGADPGKLVRECRGTVYGYARCSTLHQDYQRQIDALLKLGIRKENIFKDKKSGKDFNREEFRKLMDVLRQGDCIVVVELDRFGRNMAEIKKHWFWITQHKRADIIVLDQPVLNTRVGAHGLGAFLAELTLVVFSLMAEIERNLINKRMGDGIRLARLAGKKLGVDPKTFQSWVERTGEILDAQKWEEVKVWIEEREKEERIRQAKIEYGEMPESAAVEMEPEEMAQEVEAMQEVEVTQEMAVVKEVGVAREATIAREVAREQEVEAVQEAGVAQRMKVGREVGIAQRMEAMKEAKAGQETNAGCTDVAAGQDMPAGSGRADADGRKGCARQAVGKSHKAAERADHGATGNPNRADGGAVGKGRRNRRKSRRQKLFGEEKKKTDLSRKARRKNLRM